MIQFDALRCTICLVEYDLDNHIPRILPKCGHTVCSECLTKILEMPKPSCPLDKCSFKKKLTQVFPVNFTVRHILEETSEKDLCPVHQKPLKFLCPEKEKKLCKRCVEFLDYQNHAILKPISQVKVEGDKKREILEHRLSSLEAFEMDIRLVLEEKRVQLAKKIEEGFEDLFSMMMLKKSCMLFEVDCMFEREINKLRYVVGENSPARKNITEQLEDLKHMISKKDFFSISQFELSEGSVAFDGRSLKEQAEGFKEEMEGYLGLFGNYFQSIEDIISNFDLSRQNWIESFKIGGHSESSEDQEVAIESSCPFEILSSLQIYPNSQGYLEIVSKELQPTALLIDMEQWKTMTGVWLQLKQPFLSSQNLKILALILSKMEKINSIWVTVENQQNICEDDLMYILPVLFARTGDLEQISISFNYSAIGDRTVVFIAERILPRVKKLNSFELCLGATYITNRAVKALSRSILPYADKLNTFRIEIGRNNVSEDVIGDLFVRMPNVKNFMLGVSALNFSDRAAELFIKNTLSSMESLEILSLWMQNTTITDQSVIQLFSNIKSVKVLQTSFENTLISDKSMDVLEKSEVMKLKGLKCFDLNLNGTWVTDPIKTHIFQLKDKAYGDPQRWMGVEV